MRHTDTNAPLTGEGTRALVAPGPLCGRVRAIPSKSCAHRILLACALSEGESEICCPGPSEDIAITAACLRALGAQVRDTAGGYTVTGPFVPPGGTLFCGACATTLRFLLPVACALGGANTFTGQARLLDRPLGPLWQALESRGAALSRTEKGVLCRGGLRAGAFRLRGDVSSQFTGGLLFALPLLAGESTLTLTGTIESAPYIRMTLEVLARFGVEIHHTDDLRHFTIPGGQRYRTPGFLAVEGDWSNAAFWLTAGAVGGPVTVEGLNLHSLQGDRRILALLEAMGAQVTAGEHSVTVRAGTLRAVQTSLAHIPDLAPILCVAAAGAAGDSRFFRAERLRLKESDRIQTITQMLTALGGEVQSTGGEIRIAGKGTLTGGTVQGGGDHRIVMAAAVAAALCQKPVTICGAQATNKSYPRFFHDLQALGGQVTVLSD